MLCHEVATHLITHGHQVTVLTSTYGITRRQEEAGVHRILKLESNIHYYRPQQVLRYFIDKQTNFRAIKKIITESSPDVVVVWGMWHLSRLVAAWVEEFIGSKVVYYLSDHWPAEPSAHQAYWDGTANSLVGKVFKSLFRTPVRLALHKEWEHPSLRLEHVIVGCKAIRDKLLDSGIPVGHAKVIHHGIDPFPYQQATLHHHQPSVTLRVVFVGTLAPHKGVHTAIEAIGLLAQNNISVPVSLTVLGAGHPEYEEQLHRLVKQWHLDGLVLFHHPIPRLQLPAFLTHFDVLVMPSVYEEPLARISQEAMAAHLVLVATLTGGTKEILVDSENGLVFEPEDATDLATKLRRLTEEADLRRKLTIGGWQTVTERFTVFRMIDELETYLAKVAVQ